MRMRFGFLFACVMALAAVRGRAQTASPQAAAASTQPPDSPAQPPNAPTQPQDAQAGTGAAATSPHPALKVYSNDALHLRYSYPASFTDASAVVSAAFRASVDANAGGKAVADCMTLPFSAMSTAGGQLSIVLLVRADAGCLKRSFTPGQLPEFTQGEVRGLSASGAKPQFGEAVDFTVGGHAAEQMQGSFALPTGDSMHAMVTCVLLKPDVACWQFLGNNEESLRTMSEFPVAFGEGAPVTLVAPSATAKKP